MTPLEKIDFVFYYIKDKIQVGGNWGYHNIWNYVNATSEADINETMFKEIIQKLKNDGYITEKQIPDAQPVYNLTFTGSLFDGYNKNQVKIQKLSRQTRFLTVVVSIGTGVAAIYYLLEILNHLFCIYPKK